jgi:hypothetical protein
VTPVPKRGHASMVSLVAAHPSPYSMYDFLSINEQKKRRRKRKREPTLVVHPPSTKAKQERKTQRKPRRRKTRPTVLGPSRGIEPLERPRLARDAPSARDAVRETLDDAVLVLLLERHAYERVHIHLGAPHRRDGDRGRARERVLW